MSWYTGAVKRAIPEAFSQPSITPRGIVLHTGVSNSKSLFGYWTSPSSDGVESHFYLQKEGTAEQYVGTQTRADCQVDGNPYCISVESWDGAGVVWDRDEDIPAWNTAQVNWLVDFLVWAHRTHGIPLRLMRFMGDSGIGYHRLFIGPRPSFATKPRACPGNRKVAQIPGIIALAAKKAAGPTPSPEDDVTPEDIEKIAQRAAELVWKERLTNPIAAPDAVPPTALAYLVSLANKMDVAKGQVADLTGVPAKVDGARSDLANLLTAVQENTRRVDELLAELIRSRQA